MSTLKNLRNRVRGWFPQEPKNQISKHALVSRNNNKKVLLIVGSVAIVIGCFFLVIAVGWMLNPIVPRDSQLIRTIDENKDLLSSINGVVAVGIARNSTNNHIMGINVIVRDDMSSVQEIPKQLGDFTVYVKKISDTTEIDKGGIYWNSAEWYPSPTPT
jgi:hypothetical protein